MSMVRRWVVSCDAPGCRAQLVHEPITDGDKWDYGQATNDAGWDAGPGRDETFCPEHLSQVWREAHDLSEAASAHG